VMKPSTTKRKISRARSVNSFTGMLDMRVL
jgi:hypothetical protein